MERVFITGIAGFLGSHLADEFLKDGYEVVGNDSLLTGNKNNVPDNAEFHEVDCLNLEEMKEIMTDVNTVYHMAALPYEGLSVFSPSKINDSIYQATTTTLTAAADEGVNRFIYTSSMARYGNQELPFTEDMEPKPQDPYAISKVGAEDMTTLMADIYDFDFVIAVPHNIIGPRQKYDDPYRNVASIFINKMLQGEQPIIYGNGSQKRCFSYIGDCVRPLKKLANNKQVTGEVINIGPDDEFITINELAETIADIIGFDLDPIYVDKRPQEVSNAVCSSDKARNLIGYRTEFELVEGLKNMVSWIEQRGPKPFDYHMEPEIVCDQTPQPWREKII